MSIEVSNRDLPAGTVTFLFTDIQGSTDFTKLIDGSYAILLPDHRGMPEIPAPGSLSQGIVPGVNADRSPDIRFTIAVFHNIIK